MDNVSVRPVAMVASARRGLDDDGWDTVEAVIALSPDLPAAALDGIEAFSHVEVVFLFDRVNPASVSTGVRHPRGNPAWPRVGIFAQRAKDRPNRLGTTIVRLIARDGTRLRVRGLDAVDGTPVLDIKPVMREFLPREPVTQPSWATELMRGYWSGEPVENR